MEAEFRAPKRRTRVYEVYEGPLPLNQGLNQDQNQFRADLINKQVLIQNPDHIRILYSQGFFGKGVLSKSGPTHSVSGKWENHNGLLLPVLSQQRYEQLLKWAEHTLFSQGLDEVAVRQKLQQVSTSVSVEQVRAQVDREDPQNHNQVSSPGCGPGLDPGPDQGVSVPGPGFVLVRSESESSEAEIRRTPLGFTEYLQLSHEEAFFLVYALGCLTVYSNQEPLSVLQCWRILRSRAPDFVSSYAAYHFYRSRGWIPKTGSGAKYGTDMMLYRKGPPFYHASYSVVVERVRSGAFKDPPLRPFSWRSLSALSRITANVSKELLLCYVIFPFNQSEAELESPDCLKRLTVQEVMVSRWVSSKERTEQDDI